jgi:hypothetical protein
VLEYLSSSCLVFGAAPIIAFNDAAVHHIQGINDMRSYELQQKSGDDLLAELLVPRSIVF